MKRKMRMADDPIGPASVILKLQSGPQLMTPGKEVTADVTDNELLEFQHSKDFKFEELKRKPARARTRKNKEKKNGDL